MSRVPPPPTSAAEAGFTIIEALIALSLVALSLVAIGSLMGTSSRGARSLEQHAALMETARGLAAGARLPTGPVAGPQAGQLYGHRWQIDTTPLSGTVAAVANSPWIPEHVRIRVQSPSGAMVDVDTIRLRRVMRQ